MKITGGNNKQREQATIAYNWFASKRGKVPRCTVKLARIDFGFSGFCNPPKNKKIVIEIDKKMPLDSIVSTLFHELIHAEQFTSKMLQVKGNKFFWKGKQNNLPYSRQPWERQAYRLQNKLTQEYLNG